MTPEHDTRVVATGPTGHRARCRCGWTLDAVSAIAAARACWEHARTHNPGPAA